jgi:peroxiredoxin
MIKHALFISAACFVLNSFAQKQEKEFVFKIDGTIRNYQNKTIYVHHKKAEQSKTDSAKVVNGKFSFSLKNSEPTMYWFTTTNDANAQPNVIFFADNAPVKATLIGDSIAYSKIEGGAAQNDFMAYRQIITTLVMQQQLMQAEYGTAQQSGDNAKMMAIQQQFQTLNQEYVLNMINFIKSHPKSAMSAYVLGNDLSNPNVPIEQLMDAATYIDASLANNSYVKSVNKRLETIRGTMVGYKATNFAQNSPEGKPIKLSDFKGKYVLLDFWASWCRPCRMENPNVVAAYNRYKNKGFTVLGVSMDTNKDLWTAAIAADNLTWTHVSDLKGWGNEAGILYSVKGIPQNFLIDKEGKIVAKNLRGAELDEKLAEIIK